MTNVEKIIEKLKDPRRVQVFSLCTEEEQKIYKKAGKYNCLRWDAYSKRWLEMADFLNGKFYGHATYLIKPHWTPEKLS